MCYCQLNEHDAKCDPDEKWSFEECTERLPIESFGTLKFESWPSITHAKVINYSLIDGLILIK